MSDENGFSIDGIGVTEIPTGLTVSFQVWQTDANDVRVLVDDEPVVLYSKDIIVDGGLVRTVIPPSVTTDFFPDTSEFKLVAVTEDGQTTYADVDLTNPIWRRKENLDIEASDVDMSVIPADLRTDSARISLETTQGVSMMLNFLNSSGQIIGQATSGEQSTDYGGPGNPHRHFLGGLTAGTTYTIQAQNVPGFAPTYRSDPLTFVTPGTGSGGGGIGNPGAGGVPLGQWTDYSVIQGNVRTYDGAVRYRFGDSSLGEQYHNRHIAEFMRQNPSFRYYENNQSLQQVRGIAVPTPGVGAIYLNAPSGGDDTAYIESVINGGSGRQVVGTGATYSVRGLDFNQDDVWLWDVPMVCRGSGNVVTVHADGCRMFNCPIDGNDRNDVETGVEIRGDGCHVIDSGMKDVRFTQGSNKNTLGIVVRGSAAGYYIAGNTWENLINASGSSYTHRAGGILLTGTSSHLPRGEGWIISNSFIDFESNGKLEDADGIVSQRNSVNPAGSTLHIWANHFRDHGKRALKQQDKYAEFFSNDGEWSREFFAFSESKQLLTMVSVQVSYGSHLMMANNFNVVNADKSYSLAMLTVTYWGPRFPTYIEAEGNVGEINVDLANTSSDQRAFRMTVHSGAKGVVSGSQLNDPNSYVRENYFFGEGELDVILWLANGWTRDGVQDFSGNTVGGNLTLVNGELSTFRPYNT